MWRFTTASPPVFRLVVPTPLNQTLIPNNVWPFDPGLRICNDGEGDLSYTVSIHYHNPQITDTVKWKRSMPLLMQLSNVAVS